MNQPMFLAAIGKTAWHARLDEVTFWRIVHITQYKHPIIIHLH
ncbi:FtsP/CotA-like multicopper oxidase with cupredoxin domain [Desulfomicrobium macestii]|uniref:FtsP/CotA-like multicopper oxidase with cupredoxin domain n=1 Tax=Desulfomicrobium macestii TaxID=90731 RepID=A0ABR9H8M2_9BACT|nr:hypothetical protein [Desulfomicrobium macestii]MBE1427072.1 FtsP/CotA-like multicopper oxidase with cupredoxin domain [Desulfomicrobium macestii]